MTENKKRKNELEPFDPSDSYVHPASRMKRPVQARRRYVASSKRADEDDDEFAFGLEPDEDENADEDEDADSDAFTEDSDTPLVFHKRSRASTSAGRYSKKAFLPFSPKKTRSQKFPDYSSVLRDDGESSLTRSPSPSMREGLSTGPVMPEEMLSASSDNLQQSVPHSAEGVGKLSTITRPFLGRRYARE